MLPSDTALEALGCTDSIILKLGDSLGIYKEKLKSLKSIYASFMIYERICQLGSIKNFSVKNLRFASCNRAIPQSGLLRPSHSSFLLPGSLSAFHTP